MNPFSKLGNSNSVTKKIKRSLAAILFMVSACLGQTTNTNILPGTSGLNLGSPNQRWNVYAQNLNIAGTCTLNGASCFGGGGGGGTGNVFNGIGFGISFQDVAFSGRPSNPASGVCRLYVDNVTLQFVGLNSSGGPCMATIQQVLPSVGGGLQGGGSIGNISLGLITSCAVNQVLAWNGTVWACANSSVGSGTVTSVASGTGLTGGPVTTTGTLSITASYQLPQSCSSNQIPQWNGSIFACFSLSAYSLVVGNTPLTTTGDVMTIASGALARLAQGANGTFLGVSSGLLGYYTPAGTGTVTNTVGNLRQNTMAVGNANADVETLDQTPAKYADIPTSAAPSNPSAGYQRFYANSSTGALACLTSAGASCFNQIPLGTAAQLAVMNAGATAYAPVSMSQDCTITASGVITCTKTNNVAFVASATTDATVATNISSGTLNTARLPAVINIATGFEIGSAATSGNYLRGNGTNFVSNTIQVVDVPPLNQNTSGTAANLSGTPTLPNGTKCTTQSLGDSTTDCATDAFVLANALTNPMTTVGDVIYGGTAGAGTRLPGPTAPAAPFILISTPSGGLATAPVWSKVGLVTRTVTGSSDTILGSDNAKVVSYCNNSGSAGPPCSTATAVAVTLPQAGTGCGTSSDFCSNFVTVLAAGPGLVTVTPTTSTINNNATLLIQQQVCRITSDNTNYQAQCFNNNSATPVPTDTGAANAYVAKCAGVAAPLQVGDTCAFQAVNASTLTSATLNASGTGVVAVTRQGGIALAAGDIAATPAIAYVWYDGTEWSLMNPQATIPTTNGFVGLDTRTDTGALKTNACGRIQDLSTASTILNAMFDQSASQFVCAAVDIDPLNPAAKNKVFFGSGNGTLGSSYSTDLGFHLGTYDIIEGYATTLVTGSGGTAPPNGTILAASTHFPGNTFTLQGTAGNGHAKLISGAATSDTVLIGPGSRFEVAGDPTVYRVLLCQGTTYCYINNSALMPNALCNSGAGPCSSQFYTIAPSSNIPDSSSNFTFTPVLTSAAGTACATSCNITLLAPVIEVGDATGLNAAAQVGAGCGNCQVALTGSEVNNIATSCSAAGGAGIGGMNIYGQENTKFHNFYITDCAIGFIQEGAGNSAASTVNSGPFSDYNINYSLSFAANWGTTATQTVIPMEIDGGNAEFHRMTVNAQNVGLNSATGYQQISKGVIHITNAPGSNYGHGGTNFLHEMHVEGCNNIASPQSNSCGDGTVAHGVQDAIRIDADNTGGSITGSVILMNIIFCPTNHTCNNAVHVYSTFSGAGSLQASSLDCSTGTTNVIQDDINSNTMTCADNVEGGWYNIDNAGSATTNMNPNVSGATCTDLNTGTAFYGGVIYQCSGGVLTGKWSNSGNLNLANAGALSAEVSTAAATYTVGNLACVTATNTVGDCASAAANSFVIGVNLAKDGTRANWQTAGIANANGPSSQTWTAGDIVCTNASTAAVSQDIGAATNCPGAQRQVGIVATTNTGTSHKVTLIFSGVSVGGGGSGTVNNCATGGALGVYLSTGTAISCQTDWTYASHQIVGGSSAQLAIQALTNQMVMGGSTNLTTLNFPASSGAVTLTFPNTTDTMVGRATTDTLTNKSLSEDQLTGAGAAKTLTEAAAGDVISHASVETTNLTTGQAFYNTNSTNNNTSVGLIAGAAGTSTGGVAEALFDVSGTGDIWRAYHGGSVSAGVYTPGTLEAHVDNSGDATFLGTLTADGLSYPTSLTSGGALYASSSSAIASSGALAANTPVVGGGAGAAPTTPSISFASQTDGATVTWAIASAPFANASLTFTVHSGSRTLNITNPVNGGSYVLWLKQDGTGGEGLTLGTGCTWKVINGGAGALVLSSGANKIDVLAFTYDGTNCYATLGLNYN